jgi:enoyl-CoA hydratase
MNGNPPPKLIEERRGGIAVGTLNRQEALNALDLDLLRLLTGWLHAAESDEGIGAMLLRGAGGRAFCAGGDIRAVWAHRGDDAFMDAVYRVEYLLDDAIARAAKPIVAWMSGIVMGGGCGISVGVAHRVVTPSTILAMPECAIGLFPDVGAGHFLSRCPGAIGCYLGLTGARIGAADAIYAGLADYYVAGVDSDEAIRAIDRDGDPNRALVALASDPGPSSLAARQAMIDDIFGRDSIAAIMAALGARSEDWARDALASMGRAAPFSLALTFRMLRDPPVSRRESLRADFRIVERLMLRGDHFEGVRARLVDKDGVPRWDPPTLEAVDPDEIEACFAPLGTQELVFADEAPDTALSRRRSAPLRR